MASLRGRLPRNWGMGCTRKFVESLIRSIALAALFSAIASNGAASQEIAGRASVVDGDTLIVEGQPKRVRLFGIDAPKSAQPCTDAAGARYLCGSRAAAYLAELIGRNGRVSCVELDRDRYGRVVASCSINGRDLGDAIVRSGWAIDYVRYSRGRYEAAEEEARDAGRGLWAGDFEAPWEWRTKDRSAGRPRTIAAILTSYIRTKGPLRRDRARALEGLWAECFINAAPAEWFRPDFVRHPAASLPAASALVSGAARNKR